MEVFGKTVSGIQMGDGNMRGVILDMVDAVMSGDFPMDKIVKFYDFKDINQAVADSKSGSTGHFNLKKNKCFKFWLRSFNIL